MNPTKFISICMLLFILLVLPVFAQKSDTLFVSVTLEYNRGTVTIKDTNLIQSSEYIDKSKDTGNYTLKVYSYNGTALYETKFDFDLNILSAPPKEWFDNEGNQIYFPNETQPSKTGLDRASVVLFVPYFKTMKVLKIYDKNNNEILTSDVSKFAVCNLNSICDDKETKEVCPEDCSTRQNTSYKSLSFWQWLMGLFKSLLARIF